MAQLVAASPPAVRPSSSREWQFLTIGALLALSLHVAIQWLLHLPFWQRLVQRFIWWKDGFVPDGSPGTNPVLLGGALTSRRGRRARLSCFVDRRF